MSGDESSLGNGLLCIRLLVTGPARSPQCHPNAASENLTVCLGDFGSEVHWRACSV